MSPVSKPRMTRKDKREPRDCVINYHDFADQLNLLFAARELPENYLIVFYFEMPKSWPNKKKIAQDYQPRLSTPDKDNLEKAFLDALFSKYHNPDGIYSDSHVWDGRVIKLWAYESAIEIYQIECVLEKLRQLRRS